jgi:hypothetical protein
MTFKMKGYSAFTKEEILPEEEQAKISAEKKDIKKLTFNEAFGAADKAGKETFTWQGKEYTTEKKKERPVREVNIEEKKITTLGDIIEDKKQKLKEEKLLEEKKIQGKSKSSLNPHFPSSKAEFIIPPIKNK